MPQPSASLSLSSSSSLSFFPLSSYCSSKNPQVGFWATPTFARLTKFTSLTKPKYPLCKSMSLSAVSIEKETIISERPLTFLRETDGKDDGSVSSRFQRMIMEVPWKLSTEPGSSRRMLERDPEAVGESVEYCKTVQFSKRLVLISPLFMELCPLKPIELPRLLPLIRSPVPFPFSPPVSARFCIPRIHLLLHWILIIGISKPMLLKMLLELLGNGGLVVELI